MTPEQMATEARGAIADGARMSMVLPRGATRRLPGFPRGELMCENHDGRNVYSYDPVRVLAWLKKNDLIGAGHEVQV